MQKVGARELDSAWVRLDGNPLLDEYNRATGGKTTLTGNIEAFSSTFSARDKLVKQYAWAVPSDEALARIAKLSPIIEVGAGAGYWAALLQRHGAIVEAFDGEPPKSGENGWGHTVAYFDVQQGDHTALVGSAHKTLFLCWPPMTSMALDCLTAFEGKTVVYIGESGGGCTATDEFHEKLEAEFERVEQIDIPQWYGLHDYVGIWNRKDK